MVHVLIFEKICGLNSPIEETCEMCLELPWSAERFRVQSARCPLFLLKIVRPFYLFMSVSFELWVYWYAKGEKKNKHMFSCSINLFSQSTLSDLSESLWHNYNL